MKTIRLSWILMLLLLAGGTVVSCSETDETADEEFGNWQARNDDYLASLEGTLGRGGTASRKIKTFTKDETTEGVATDYIYVQVLEQGSGTASPLYTDSVRISYCGRLIPTASYPQGYVFDGTYDGDYNPRTTGVIDGLVSSFTEGFATALQHMHAGDRWRVYIPYQLGYGASASGSVPAYSVMIFDLALIDFTSAGEAFAPWASRQPSVVR